jgi:triacylglycerol lipase
MSVTPVDAGVPHEIAQRIRTGGAVLDLALAHEIYRPLLAQQPRDGVVVTRDHAYGNDSRHRLDVYQPAEAAVGRPIMVFLHGGGFVRGDKANRENVGQFFARHGLNVIVPNYRLAPDHHWPAGAEDVIAVYRWTLQRRDLFGRGVETIYLAGESAGAAHVATACLLRRFHPTEGLQIAGVALISGVYNVHLEKLARRQFGVATPDPRNEAYFGSKFDRYPQMSTVDLIDARPFRLFISFAELDLLQMQVQAGELFARLVCQHGFDPELRVIRDHNHLTQVQGINTGDNSLAGPLLAFMGMS